MLTGACLTDAKYAAAAAVSVWEVLVLDCVAVLVAVDIAVEDAGALDALFLQAANAKTARPCKRLRKERRVVFGWLTASVYHPWWATGTFLALQTSKEISRLRYATLEMTCLNGVKRRVSSPRAESSESRGLPRVWHSLV